MLTFSVVTVCKNAHDTIGRARNSLLRQRYTNWEWIVVDGNSSDGTVEIAKAGITPEHNLRLISEPDSGIYDAMNKGVRAARGQFVHFLNADDSYRDEGVLEDVSAEIQRVPEVDFLYGNIIVNLPNSTEVLYRPPPPEGALDEMVCGCLPHQGSFFRRDLFHGEIGMFDTTLRTAGDFKWMLRAVSNPRVKLHYLDRDIANFSADGASAKLNESLPESFQVINADTAFQQRIGASRLVGCYQRHVLLLRTQLKSAASDVARLGAERDNLKRKLSETKARLDKPRPRPDTPRSSAIKSWLRKLLRL